MSKLPTMEPAEFYLFLQKILEAPMHIARKILWWQKIEIPDNSKQTIFDYYLNIATRKERKLFTEIVSVDNDYSVNLRVQIQSPNKRIYFQKIKSIEKISLSTLEFIKINILRLI